MRCLLFTAQIVSNETENESRYTAALLIIVHANQLYGPVQTTRTTYPSMNHARLSSLEEWSSGFHSSLSPRHYSRKQTMMHSYAARSELMETDAISSHAKPRKHFVCRLELAFPSAEFR